MGNQLEGFTLHNMRLHTQNRVMVPYLRPEVLNGTGECLAVETIRGVAYQTHTSVGAS